ncbi:MAG: glutaredoxin family protein [Thermoplasmatota archaeon]
MKQREVSERAFKVVAFWSTVAAVVALAIAINALAFTHAWLVFVIALLAGGTLAALPVLLRPRTEPGFTVVLYTREGCSLCDEARLVLEEMRPRYDFTIWERDIDGDADLTARYSDAVPVLALGDEELGRLGIDWGAVEARFRSAARARLRPKPFG